MIRLNHIGSNRNDFMHIYDCYHFSLEIFAYHVFLKKIAGSTRPIAANPFVVFADFVTRLTHYPSPSAYPEGESSSLTSQLDRANFVVKISSKVNVHIFRKDAAGTQMWQIANKKPIFDLMNEHHVDAFRKALKEHEAKAKTLGAPLENFGYPKFEII